jgi:hypothetical protein
MRRLPVLILLSVFSVAGACGGGSAPQTPVPQSVNAALEQFLAAVKANDLSRMGGLWGTDRGPAAQWMKGEELRQRLAVIQKYLDHVGYRIIEGPLVVPNRNDLRTFRVDLQRGRCNQVVPIDVVRTRSGGWLVYDVHLEAAGTPNARCQPAGSGTRQ